MEPIDLRAVGDRIEALLDQLESTLEARAWEQVEDVVSLVTQLYGGGLARILELAGDDGALRERLADDDLVASLLLLHDLHPDPDQAWAEMERIELDRPGSVVTSGPTSTPVSIGRKPQPARP
jgi:hypothetical protein